MDQQQRDRVIGIALEKLAASHNAPNNPKLWAHAIAQAKQKFDVYPSAYANQWAVKWYEGKGGGWHKEKEAEASFSPPAAARSNAARALEMRRQHHRGGLSTQEASRQGIGSGVARASALSSGRSIPLATVKRMHAYFSRHEVDKKATGFRQGEPGYPSAGRIAWDLWGGDSGKAWADSIVRSSGNQKGD